MVCSTLLAMLMKILLDERSVFHFFSESERVAPGLMAFVAPTVNREPHWNLVYPDQYGHRYTPTELDKIDAFYAAHGAEGHVVTFEDEWAPIAAETSEYFFIDGTGTPAPAVAEVDVVTPRAQTLEEFSTVVARAFTFDAPTATYFHAQMVKIAAAVDSKFWIARQGGAPCGTASTFQGESDADFLFNVGVLPEFEGQGIAKGMLSQVVQGSRRPLYTYSDNPAMQKNILPSLGFTSAGKIHIVRTAVYRERVYGRAP